MVLVCGVVCAVTAACSGGADTPSDPVASAAPPTVAEAPQPRPGAITGGVDLPAGDGTEEPESAPGVRTWRVADDGGGGGGDLDAATVDEVRRRLVSADAAGVPHASVADQAITRTGAAALTDASGSEAAQMQKLLGSHYRAGWFRELTGDDPLVRHVRVALFSSAAAAQEAHLLLDRPVGCVPTGDATSSVPAAVAYTCTGTADGAPGGTESMAGAVVRVVTGDLVVEVAVFGEGATAAAADTLARAQIAAAG